MVLDETNSDNQVRRYGITYKQLTSVGLDLWTSKRTQVLARVTVSVCEAVETVTAEIWLEHQPLLDSYIIHCLRLVRRWLGLVMRIPSDVK
jgi:hypothetical protein